MSAFDPLRTLAKHETVVKDKTSGGRMGGLVLFGALLFGGCALSSVSHAATPVTVAILSYTEEQRGPLDAVNAFFAAVEAKRREQILAAVVPEGLATLVRLHDGASPTLVSWHWASYVEDVVAGGDIYTERIFNAQVLIERDMAMVWGRFAVYANGKLSHCGVDQFQLVRKNGRWLIYNLTWTSQLSGCLASKR